MAKTKGIRKAKHGKRHSRKKYGGERFETMDDIINKKTELEKERKELDNNLEKLEILQYLKSYSELKPRISEYLLEKTDKDKYQKFIETQRQIDDYDNNPIEKYKNLSRSNLKKEIKSLETDLRNKVRNKGIGDLRMELNTLKTTCPTKVDVIVERITSDNRRGGYDSTFEGEIKSVGDFKCEADGKGTIIVKKDIDPEKNGKPREVIADKGVVPLQGDDIGKYDDILKTRENAKNTEKLPEWRETPDIPDHAFTPDVERSVEIKREKAERKFLKPWTDSPDYKFDGSPNWKKIYNFFNSQGLVKPIVLTEEYEKFMKEKGLLLKDAELRKQSQDGKCKHDAFTLDQIRRCDLKDKYGPLSRNQILLLIHPDKQNNPYCETAAEEKFSTFQNKDDPNADNKGDLKKKIPPNVQCKYGKGEFKKGGKKSKKTQRKRKRKHRASSRH